MFSACKLFFFPSLRLTGRPQPTSQAAPPMTVCQDVFQPRTVAPEAALAPAPAAPRQEEPSNVKVRTNTNDSSGAKPHAYEAPEIDEEYYVSPEELDLCLF